MGVIGLAYVLLLWRAEPIWLDYLGAILTVPLSLFGAHLARRRMQALNIL
jgi:hypothetical protein